MSLQVFLRLAVSLAIVLGSFSSIAAAAPSKRIVTPDAVPVQTAVNQAVPFDPVAPAQPEKGKVVNFTLEAIRAKLEVSPGVVKEVWTFNGQVPAPTLRVNQGDTVHFTLVNRDPDMVHGLDFHAGQMDMGTYHKPIKPGESVSFDWKAEYPGVFYYHCSADPVIMHIANGMFGAVIVDPPGYKPEGKEYVLIQSEWYEHSTNLQALLEESPQAIAFNGVAAQYVDKPLTADPGEKVRFYFVNAGINHFSAFHVIGTIFDQVMLDGNPKNTLYGVQTVAVPPGGAVVSDLYADTGTYAILTHSMKDAMKGGLGILKVGKPTGTASAQTGSQPLTNSSASASTSTNESADSGKAVEGNVVHIANFTFSPDTITVTAGTKVIWINDEGSAHSIVGDTFDSRNEKKDGFIKGESFSYTFAQPGTYKYHCSFHPFMTGTVIVK
ncbi:plastocyanin/azurin family copper-binding protein [Ferviditalea candida]|uniref:Copper-containing nitrite reductase n=1 Tax=Ferviditalea candida TaxID=3108399 RepID=A0ABU5ZPT9_9BACL|nr:plastocyanin/azurin family copper-binding protein [Paenibacillaceae bacterium T2]